MTYIFGDLGRCWSIFKDLGSKGKILLGSRGNYFQGSGEINALFSGIKGAQTPPPPLGAQFVSCLGLSIIGSEILLTLRLFNKTYYNNYKSKGMLS